MENSIKAHRIDVVVKYFFPLKAGIETNVANVYGNLVNEGWRVTLHTTKDMPGKPNSLPDSDNIKGVNVKRYRWNWFGYVPKIDLNRSEAICLHNFDIFPHSWILIGLGVRKVLGFKTPKIFLTPHGGFTPGWETFPLWQRLLKKSYQKIIGVSLINCFVDGYRSVSAWEAVESVKNGVNNKKIHVITNGIEEESYLDVDKKASKNITNFVKDTSPYILQLGRIHPIKNQATSIKALELLPKNIKLVLAGPVTDFEYKKQLDQLIKKLKLDKRVIFVGTVEGVDKYYLLKHCLAYTHMALWESYCNTVHESMSQGCVCIVSKDTALEELIINKKSGFTVGVFDYKSVAKTIVFILDNNNKATIDKIKKKAFDYTKNHSWKEIARQVGEMYNKYL